ncbi:MAG: DUF3788 family protein [Candidatus Limnocylindrales bacterium]|jgi:hypothetical protein
MTGPANDRPAPPTAADLAELLGPAGDLWTELQQAATTRCAPVTERWVYGGRKYGWSCRLERGKKGLYMTPDADHFRLGLALPDAAREAALAGDLPPAIRDELAGATRAMEGWPVRVSVRTAADLAVALKLAEIKLSS